MIKNDTFLDQIGIKTEWTKVLIRHVLTRQWILLLYNFSLQWGASWDLWVLSDASVWESAVHFHSLGKRPLCLLPLCSPIYFYCLITILMSSNLYLCCSSVFYTIIRAGRWFEYVVWERFRAAGGVLTEWLVYGLNMHINTQTNCYWCAYGIHFCKFISLCVCLPSLQTATDSHTSHIRAGSKNHKDFLY